MKAVIKGLVCDTETATELYTQKTVGIDNITTIVYEAPEGHKFAVECESVITLMPEEE